MMVLISYDVQTGDREGAKRLRKNSKGMSKSCSKSAKFSL